MKPRELPERPHPYIVLRCEPCNLDWSACRSDYFLHPADEDMACGHCGGPVAVRKKVVHYERP